MARFGFKIVLCLVIAFAAALAFFAYRSGDPVYTLYEWVSPARFQQYNKLITSVAAEYHLDPKLLKAVIWQESHFDAQKVGTAGERGLMQVSEKVAGEWARDKKIENFRVEELFDPKTNLAAGTWYLRRAIEHWQNQSNPVPFALAEYNAGASRALRWAGGDDTKPVATKVFLDNIDFHGTRKYVDSIIARYKFYKRRGRM